MKVCVIGDIHGELEKLNKIPLSETDLILLNGDLGKAKLMREMTFENLKRKENGLPEIKYSERQERKALKEAYNSTLKIVKYVSKFAPVYTIFGNVELSKYESKKKTEMPSLSKTLNQMKNVKVINNKVVKFNGIEIGGLEYFIDVCWVKGFRPFDFDKIKKVACRETQRAKKALDQFDYVDILLCHQPPYGILDKVNSSHAPKSWQGKHAGSREILNYIKSQKPKYVFCGHIHEAKGMKKLGKTKIYNLGYAGYEVIYL